MADSDWTVAELVEDYQAGRLGRRDFVRLLLSVGIGMPLIATILAACGSSNNKATSTNSGATTGTQVAAPSAAAASGGSATVAAAASGGSATAAAAAKSPTAAAFTPTKRGGGGTLKLFWWQAPSILNPHLSGGTKDQDGSRLFMEPLAGLDQEGNIIPILAAEVPNYDKGTLDKGGTFVVWKLKKGVTWHDGNPLTADDVVFTYDAVTDPDSSALSANRYANVKSVEKVDDLTVKVTFQRGNAGVEHALCRQRRLDHTQAHLQRLQGQGVPQRPGEPQADRHRALQDQHVQPQRQYPCRHQRQVPCREPSLLRQGRNEGRGRRPGRGAGRAGVG